MGAAAAAVGGVKPGMNDAEFFRAILEQIVQTFTAGTPLFLTIDELSAHLGLPKKLLVRLTSIGVLRVYRFSGRVVKYRPDEVLEDVVRFRHGGRPFRAT